MCPFVKTLHNYVQIIVYRGERELTNIFRPDTEINGNNRLSYRYIDLYIVVTKQSESLNTCAKKVKQLNKRI